MAKGRGTKRKASSIATPTTGASSDQSQPPSVQHVIEGQTEQLGASHTSTLTTQTFLAILHDEMGEVDAARKLYEISCA